MDNVYSRYNTIIDLYKDVYESFDKYTEEGFEKRDATYWEPLKELWKGSTPEVFEKLEKALNDVYYKLVELLRHERQSDKVPYIEYPKDPTDEELEEWNEREAEAGRAFCEEIETMINDVETLFNETFEPGDLWYGYREELMKEVFDDANRNDQFNHFTIYGYKGNLFLDLGNNWEPEILWDFEKIKTFHPVDFYCYIYECLVIIGASDRGVFDRVMVDEECFSDLVELFFEHKKNVDVDDEVIEVLKQWNDFD